MKQKLIPVGMMLVIMAIISLPTQSNEFIGKAICQTSIPKVGQAYPAPAADCDENPFIKSPALLLLTL